MKKYMTGGFGEKLIEEVEVVKETNKTVWVEQYRRDQKSIRQERKDSSWHKYFDTFEEAKNHLTEQSKRKIENYRRQAEEEEVYLKRVISFKILES